MKRVWDTLIILFVSMFAVSALLAMIRPYVPWMLVGGLVFLAAKTWFIHSRNW